MSALLLSLLSSFLLFSVSKGSPGRCLSEGKQQKSTPSAEPGLQTCPQYSNNACCSSVHQHTPLISTFPWDQCGPLSPRCETHIRQVECMYFCSPHISAWGNPESASGIMDLPLCSHFCDEWFEACKDDLICPEEHGTATNCSQDCHTFTQAFGSGRQQCENIWHHSFIAVDTPCFCVTPPQPGDDPSRQDPTITGPSESSMRCMPEPLKDLAQNRVRKVLRKRSDFIEDVEGSGSGL
ncbi:riboflavin-binding protein-like [Pelodytes ibericus]